MINLIELILGGIMIGGIYSLVGASVVLVYKSTHVVSIAHGQLLAFGALLFYIFLVGLGLPFIVSLSLALIGIALIGLAIERFALRPLIGQPLFAAFMMTFTLFIAMDGVLQLVLKGEAKSYPSYFSQATFKVGFLNLPSAQVVSFILAIIIFIALGLFFKYTKAGLSMRATAEDHRLAQSTGVSVKGVFSLVWVISAAVAGVAGIAAAFVMDIYYPLPYIGIKGIIVGLCGGLDSLTGALLIGLLLGVMEQLGAGYLDPIVGGGIEEVAGYVMLLVIMLIRPYGLLGLVRIERI
jgi:branched-chain amino acid transport system permease protein